MSTSFQAKHRFYDDRHFRRGFSRSGMFTIKEAELLERCGHAFKDLDENLRPPQDEIEQSFTLACRGEQEPNSVEQKVWLKYKKLSGRKRFHGLVSSPVKHHVHDTDLAEGDIEVDDRIEPGDVSVESD